MMATKELSPEHKLKMQNGKQTKARIERERKIQEHTLGKRCGCGIKPTMGDLELRALYPGCCDGAGYICPVLDGIMRSVYTY